MTSQRQLNEFFQRTPSNNAPRQPNTPERTNIPPQVAPQPQIAPNVVPLPPPIIKTINSLCTKYAGLYCASLNINETVTALNKHKTDGTVPPQMNYKFKKLFTKENETNLRSTVINAAIDQELTRLQSKQMELNTSYENRLHDLEETVSNPLNLCDYTIDPPLIVSTFNETLQQRKLEYILKQNKDKEKKLAKQQAFQTRREADNEVATLSTRQVSKLNQEIKELKDNLKKVKISINSKPKSSNNRSKNSKGGQTKPTGKKRKNAGRKKSTTGNK